MNPAALLFRIRGIIFVLLYVLGFLPPWQRPFGIGHATLWLTASTELARSGWIGLAGASLTVTILGLASLVTGTAMRVWGAAHWSPAAMGAGPNRSLGNSLNIGSWLVALGVSLLMPLAGALLFLLTFTVFTLLLIFTERRFFANTSTAATPRWLRALLAETYPVAFTLCFAVFAWRYNARVLIQCLLICFGMSLVTRALVKGT